MGNDSNNDMELRDEGVYPNDTILKEVLGDSFPVYEKVLALFEDNGLSSEWRYYRDGKAWLCKVQKKKQTIVWMSAWKGFFRGVIYFPLRLLDDVLALDISEDMKGYIGETKNVGKSKPCIFDIHSEEILSDFEQVMNWKIASK